MPDKQRSSQLTDMVNKYLDYLTVERQLSSHTINNYQRQLQKIIEILQNYTIHSWQQIDVNIVRFIIAQSKLEGLHAKSLALRLSVLRSFFNFMVQIKLLEVNPAKMVLSPKQPKSLPKNLSPDDMEKLLDIDIPTPIAMRDLAMMELTYSSGLRLAELQSLNIDSIDLNAKELRVIGKGNKERMIPCTNIAVNAVCEWLRVRNQFKPNENERALFLNNRGKRISNRSIELRMKLWGKKNNLTNSVHPHKLRHSFATDMLQGSSDLRAVQELLGHANLATTQIYTHLDFKHLSGVYNNSHPRAKRKK